MHRAGVWPCVGVGSSHRIHSPENILKTNGKIYTRRQRFGLVDVSAIVSTAIIIDALTYLFLVSVPILDLSVANSN